MNRNFLARMKSAVLAVLVAATSTVLIADSTVPAATADVPPVAAAPDRYIIVLHQSRVGDDRGAKWDDKEIERHGGQLLEKWGTRRVVRLPPPALSAIIAHSAVRYVQRVQTAEGLGPVAEKQESADLRAETNWAPPTWFSGDYKYDPSGNIRAVGTALAPNSDAKTNTYIYDTAGRLVSATVNHATNNTETYAYDSFGNLTSKTTNALTTPIPTATSTNRLQGVEYDVAGNLARDGNTYVFDPVNMMRAKLGPNGGSDYHEFYIYNAFDERIGIETNTYNENVVRWTIRDIDGKAVREFESPGGPQYDWGSWLWVEDHIYNGSQIVAGERETADGGQRHFHVDHLGTPRLITNESGMKLAVHDYYPFGTEQTSFLQEQVDHDHDRPELRKFTSHERDFTGGIQSDHQNYLDYMHARYYQPVKGRFLSVDPKLDVSKTTREPQRWNRYVYALNNPVKLIDADGRDVHVAPGMEQAVDQGLRYSATFAQMYQRLDRDPRVYWLIRPMAFAKPGTRADSQQPLPQRDAAGRVTRVMTFSNIPTSNPLQVQAGLIGHEGAHVSEILDTGRTLKERHNAGERNVYPNQAAGPNAFESVNALQIEQAIRSEISRQIELLPSRDLDERLRKALGGT
jgi:RHS repeat-associated protein